MSAGPDPPCGSGPARAFRGGSWLYGDWFCRSAFRGRGDRLFRRSDIGFRLALSKPVGKSPEADE